jgi:AraC family transcriptional regulator
MDYTERIQTAIDFIEDNLKQEIKTSAVASTAGFSEYHFHRIFQAMLGESVADYIRKRRLSEAAEMIKHTSSKIRDIAFESQYETQESFTRSFKKMFGVSPLQYRQLGNEIANYHKRKVSKEMIKHLQQGLTMEPRFEQREKELAIGLGDTFAEECSPEIEKLWNKFQSRMHEIENVKPGYALGICMATHPEVIKKPDTTFVYAATLPVSAIGKVPPGMTVFEIPPGKYAVFTHNGSLDTLTHTANYIWGTWIPKNADNYRHADGPDFELYDKRFNPQTRSGEIHIFIPIK